MTKRPLNSTIPGFSSAGLKGILSSRYPLHKWR